MSSLTLLPLGEEPNSLSTDHERVVSRDRMCSSDTAGVQSPVEKVAQILLLLPSAPFGLVCWEPLSHQVQLP